MRPAAWLVDLSLIAVAFIWGSTFVIVKDALSDVSTLLFLTLRFAAATAALALLFRRRLNLAALRSAGRGAMLAGVLLFTGYVLQTAGLRHTSPAKAGFITGLYVPFVPLLNVAIFRRLPQPAELIGTALAFAGFVLMTAQREIFRVGPGDLLVAGCAVAYALHTIVLGKIAPSADPGLLTLLQIATGAALGAASFWWLEPVRLTWSSGVLFALAVTSLLATALAFWVQTWAQGYSSPTRIALIFTLEPVFAWLTSYLFTGETLSRRGTGGAILILAGILAVELRPTRREDHLATP